MLADISGVDAIYIVTGYTDMRKSIDGLCAIIQDQLPQTENTNALYLFCGRKCDRIKAILKESDGIVMIYKRLTAQGRYRWPRDRSEVRNTLYLTTGQLIRLFMNGGQRSVHPESVCGSAAAGGIYSDGNGL